MRVLRPPLLRGPVRSAVVAAAVLSLTAPLLAASGAPGATGPPGTRTGAGAGVDRPPQAPPGFPGPELDEWVRAAVAAMPLEHKVGQVFTTYVYGDDAHTPDPRNTERYGVATPAEVVSKYHLGGVIYFSWSDNLKGGPRQIARLSNGLQRSALASGPRLPLLVSTDQEYGLITRIGPPATQFPGNMALGASRSVRLTRLAARIGGRELRAMGVNQNFAPVADVNVNPANPVIGVRSFSSDPELAASLTTAQVEGYQGDGGVAAAAKHFPGHGDTETDSHTGIPTITHTEEQWERIDAPPFRAAIDAGIDVIMTGHLVMPGLDPTGTPGTLSRPILTGLLREELGYDGVVVTDSLEMDGVRLRYGDDRIPVMALAAGADMLLMPHDLGLAQRAVLAAVRSGEVPVARLDQAVARVLKLKAVRGVVARPLVDEAEAGELVGPPGHLRRAREISDRTTTLVKNAKGVLPLRSAPGSLLVAGAGSAETAALAEAVRTYGTAATALVTGVGPTDADIAGAVARAERHEVTVVLTQRAAGPVADSGRRQARLVQQLLVTGRPVIVAAVREPYDIGRFTGAPALLATYSAARVAMDSLAAVLYGERAPTGRLPVSIPDPDAPGTDLYAFGHGLTW